MTASALRMPAYAQYQRARKTRMAEQRIVVEARVENAFERHLVSLTTNGASHEISIAPRSSGFGSRANGGELLCLALATCYCNDIYREAERRGIAVHRVVVEATGEFGAVGEPARALRYRASVLADANERDIRDLMLHTDRVAEVQNTLRRGLPVEFESGRAERATSEVLRDTDDGMA
jgi:organic hydroperoxide reductase OsmC/OhrA